MKADRYFYSAAAGIFLLLTFIGFFAFFTHGTGAGGRPITPQVHTVVVVHGLAIMIWLLLFQLQALLITVRKPKLHMKLGWSALAVGLVVAISGVQTAIGSVRFTPPEFMIFGMNYRDFLLVMLTEIAVFTAFVTAGLLTRKRPEVHRSMMLLASLSVLLGATARIPFLMDLFGGENTRTGFFCPTFVLALILLLVRWATTRRFDRSFAVGYVALVVLYLGAEQLSRTDAWRQTVVAIIGS